MNNNQVAHLWANKSRASAKGSHFYYDGDVIYSYGSHFPIARHHRGVVLFTSAGYSNSTARHKSCVLNSITHLDCFVVENVLSNPCRSDLKAYDKRLTALATRASRARDPQWLIDALQRETDQANKFAETFGFKTRFSMPEAGELDALRERSKLAQSKKAKATAERNARIERENQELVKQWIAGEPVSVPWQIQTVYLRKIVRDNVTPCGQIIEMQTSRGALAPLEDAQRAFRFVISRRERGWRRNGEQCKVGEFQLDAVNEFGVVAGCHRVAWAEIERFAKAQGWL